MNSLRRLLPSFPALLLTGVLAWILFGPLEGGRGPAGTGRGETADAPARADRPDHVDHADHAGHAAAPAAGSSSDGSLYLLPGTWTDQHGRTLELADLAGRPQVVAMVYTHCTFACPRILAQMKRIEAALDPSAAGFVLVSIDPGRDTPERLDDFARSTRLDPERWRLLNGSDDDVRALSVLLGVKYRATGEGDFAHSNVLTVLDADGRVVDRVRGLGADVAPAVRTLQRLTASDRPGS